MISERMPGEAERKFWKCPELVEKVLPFLDSYSTLQLAKVGLFIKYGYIDMQDIKCNQTHIS